MGRLRNVMWLVPALVLGFILSGSQFLSAEQPAGRRGFGGRAPFMLGLELTQEQQSQIKAIMDEQRQQRAEADRPGELQRQLRKELLADAPDEARIDALRTQILEAEQQMLERRIDVQKRIAAVLTPEQRAQARERLDAAPRGRRPGRQR